MFYWTAVHTVDSLRGELFLCCSTSFNPLLKRPLASVLMRTFQSLGLNPSTSSPETRTFCCSGQKDVRSLITVSSTPGRSGHSPADPTENLKRKWSVQTTLVKQLGSGFITGSLPRQLPCVGADDESRKESRTSWGGLWTDPRNDEQNGIPFRLWILQGSFVGIPGSESHVLTLMVLNEGNVELMRWKHMMFLHRSWRDRG